VTPGKHRMFGAPKRGTALMIVLMIVVIVLIGVAYADYCLIDNTAHFGICFQKVAEAEQTLSAEPRADATETLAPAELEPIEAIEAPVLPPRNPAHMWLIPDLEPVLELHEERTGTSG